MTIAICTRNRDFILGHAIDSLLYQLEGRQGEVELLIVDNGSTDTTASLVREKMQGCNQIRYVYEPVVGLSRARNTAWQVSPDSRWIFYMDDDARAASNLVERSLEVIHSGKYDCFGGTYYAWFPFGKPKWWPETWGAKSDIPTQDGYIDLKSGFLSGSVFCVKRASLIQSTGFAEGFGMCDTIGYGEENVLQKVLCSMGNRIGYNASIYIYHAVLPEKHCLSWQFRSGRRSGLDQQRVKEDADIGRQLLKLLRVSAGSVVMRTPVCLYNFIFKKHYYWQNLLLDICLPIIKCVGHVEGSWIVRKECIK